MSIQSLRQDISYYQVTESLNAQLQSIAGRMQAHLPELDRVSFALFDEDQNSLKTYADSAFWNLQQAHNEASMKELPVLTRCALLGTHRIIDDLTQLPSNKHIEMLLEYGYRSSAAIPCYENEQFKGFIFLNSRRLNVFSDQVVSDLAPYLDMIKFCVMSENQIVHRIVDSAREILNEANVCPSDFIAHKERIAYYTRVIASHIAENYDFDDETVEHLSLFAQFHDLGKVRLPEHLVGQHQPLATDVRNQLHCYVQHGLDIVDEILEKLGYPQHPSVVLLTEIMAHHKEFLDGSGYPNGLSGSDIPISARIVAVANVFDALTVHRPHRQAWSIPLAILEMEKMVNRGQLDRQCVDALREHQSEISTERERYPECDPSQLNSVSPP